MSRSFNSLALLIAMLTALPSLTRAQPKGTPTGSNATRTDFRYSMMVSAGIDGYPNDNDIAAIGRYLAAAGDERLEVPEDIAQWVLSKIGQEGPNALPRLISPYMHFLRKSAVAPPFDPGIPGSSRFRLLKAMENDLVEHSTPVSDLALAMFKEVNDQSLRVAANDADYSALKSYPWVIGHQDWMDWIQVGLNPDPTHSPDTVLRAPEFPVVSDQAKAGLLLNVRSFVATLDIRPPVTASSANFRDFTNNGPQSWGYIKDRSNVSASNNQDMLNQAVAFAKMISPRFAATLGVQPVDAARIDGDVGTLSSFTPDPNVVVEALYGESTGLAHSVSPSRFTRLFSVFLLQQQRLLALASYALVVHQRRDHLPAADIAMDKIFSQLAAIDLPTSEKKTELVAALPSTQLGSGAWDLTGITQCKPTSASVVRRVVSLPDHTYVETIRAVCVDGKSLQFERAGVLSTDILRMLEMNPYFLDMTEVSLAMRDLANSTSEFEQNPEDIDLIRADPKLAAALNLGALAHPEVPWEYVRAALLQNWPISIEWLTPGWSPRPEFGDYPPPPVVLLNQHDFEDMKNKYLSVEMNRLQYVANKRYIDGITPTINALPETITVKSPTPTGGVQYTTYDSGKDKVVQALNSMINETNGYRSGALILSDQECIPASLQPLLTMLPDEPIPPFILRQTIEHNQSLKTRGLAYPDNLQVAINENTHEFVSHYFHGGCEGAAQGYLSLSDVAADALQQALTQDPIFLNRYQLDVLPSIDDWANRMGAALTNASHETELAAQTLWYLQSTDLLYYLPSIRAPIAEFNMGAVDPTAFYANSSQLSKWRCGDLQANCVYDSYTSALTEIGLTLTDQSPFDAMMAPLIRSQTGMDLAKDLANLQLLVHGLPPPLKFDRPSFSDDFIDSLRGLEKQALEKADEQADTQIQKYKSQLQSSPTSTPLTFGISLSVGEGVVPGFYFSYGNVGISVSLELPSVALVIPTLAPFQVLDLPLVLPGSMALGPFVPSFSIPLSTSPNGASPAADATNLSVPQPQDDTSRSAISKPSEGRVLVSDSQVPSNTITAGAPGANSDLDAAFANINWGTLLSANNYAGRMWLSNEVSIATPLLTPAQLGLISQWFEQPTFPEPLAKQIAAYAAEASAQSGKPPEAASFSQIVEAACTKSTWSNCGVAIKAALDKKPTDPKEIVNLALLWAGAYGARYDELRRQGRLENSIPDSEKISEAIKSKIDPVDFAKDTVNDAIIKAVLRKLAFIAEALGSDWMKAALDPSEIKSDFDELEFMNRILQVEINQELEPFMKDNWRELLIQAIGQTEWMKP